MSNDAMLNLLYWIDGHGWRLFCAAFVISWNFGGSAWLALGRSLRNKDRF